MSLLLSDSFAPPAPPSVVPVFRRARSRPDGSRLLLHDAFAPTDLPVLPPPPPVVFASPFSALVAQIDRAAQSLLGGEPVIYAPAVGPAVPITGIFDALYVLSQGTAEAGVEALGPAVFLELVDIPVDPEFDDPVLTIRGLDYRVVERRPDDMNGIVLVLRLVH